MSKYVDEIIKDLKANPKSYLDYKGCGVKNDNIIIDNYGNTRLLSVIWLYINLKPMPITYMDKWRLEVAVKNWYKNASLETIKK